MDFWKYMNDYIKILFKLENVDLAYLYYNVQDGWHFWIWIPFKVSSMTFTRFNSIQFNSAKFIEANFCQASALKDLKEHIV